MAQPMAVASQLPSVGASYGSDRCKRIADLGWRSNNASNRHVAATRKKNLFMKSSSITINNKSIFLASESIDISN